MLRNSLVKLTSSKSSYDLNDLQMNQDESLISFFNHCLPRLPKLASFIEDPCGDRSLQILRIDDVAIFFRRTIRVPETGRSNNLPPGLGNFPLYKVAEFSRALPQDMVEKGGWFFPMYQREAMWLQFRCRSEFAIRIYVGGINAITGEPKIPNMAIGVDKNQDYIVVPEQHWIDGIATGPGMVKQFVAVPYGSGFSVEYQITGSETIGGIQFEVIPPYHHRSVRFEGRDIYCTPRELGLSLGSELTMTNLRVDPFPIASGSMRITISTLTGKKIIVFAENSDTINILKSRLQEKEGFPKSIQWIYFAGKELEEDQTLLDYNIQEESRVFVILTLRGGGGLVKGWDLALPMGFGTGGTIKQVIVKDPNNPRIWDVERAGIVNVQVMNAARFEDITKMMAPPTPVDIKTYAAAGLPFFDVFNELPTDIHGYYKFKKVKTVSEMDQILDVGSNIMYEPGTYIPLQKCQCRKNMLDLFVLATTPFAQFVQHTVLALFARFA
ncbi:hypothetical protein DEU56DRAFT_918393 [Suillus clintonianus]|uniref:uncharacterized protein n=1 Tax=Suillus clintonianus TaxID=1904413 RepID=UPI001B879117|nr:uncharacterized protein DEU56DRAFT_918393 [Suillus clintonianus]KAG2120246.1 hypothetical protein DEU56DRAFT_918393 [Suillus clintonianus]